MITTEGLTRRFGDQNAVAGIDLRVDAGEIYGFLGPNGAGKSTTVKMLCTLLVPSAGHASVAGFDVVADSLAVRLHIGVALQEASLDPTQTGVELLRLQGRLYGLSSGEIDQRITELAELVDIGEALERRIKTYSGGMKRRLDLAAALIHNPRVLFLDEPTTGLDPASRARVWDEVRRLNAAGMTIFLTTQYLEEADELADRVGIIDRGRIIAEDAPDALKRELGSDVIVARIHGDTSRARTALDALDAVQRVDVHGDGLTIVTADAPQLLSPVAVTLAECGVRVLDLTMRTPTLDDVFLELTGGHLDVREVVEEGTE